MTRMASLFGQTRLTVFVATLSLVVLASPGAGQAQTTSITPTTGVGDLGTSVSPPAGNVYDITGGTRPGGGANLFHSFGEFSVGTNNIANFLNDTAMPTTNILSRVTGGNPSNIFGTLQTTNFGAANLYLINPAGVMFGPTAELNVGGSFAASTADYLKMADGATFSANPVQPTVLSMAPVSTFGFLGANPTGTITVQGGTVNNASTLTLVGRDIVDGNGNTTTPGILVTGGTLSNPDGQINLVSVGLPQDLVKGGEIQAPSLTSAPAPSGHAFSTMGEITLSRASLDTSGTTGGGVVIRGGQLTIDNGRITANKTGNTSDSPAGIDIKLDGAFALNLSEQILALDTQTFGAGDGGAVKIAASKVTLNYTGGEEGESITVLSSGTGGAGKGGDVVITATGEVNLNRVLIGTDTVGTGSAGSIVIKGENVTLTNSQISSSGVFGKGNSGALEIEATSSVKLIGPSKVESTSGSGQLPGNVTITAKDLSMKDGAVITAHTQGAGNAGNIIIKADNLVIGGESPLTGAFIRNDSIQGATGNAGSIDLSVGRLTLNPHSLFSSVSAGGGNAGTVEVHGLGGKGTAASAITLDNSTISTVIAGGNSSSVPAGIKIAAQTVNLTNRAQITADTNGAAPAGNIALNVDTLMVGNFSTISSSSSLFDSTAGNAGNITIQGITGSGSPAAHVNLDNSSISTTILGGSAANTAANIAITAHTLALAQAQPIRAGIVADTNGAAPAGDIVLHVGTLTSAGIFSTISSSSISFDDIAAGGNAGNITIQGITGSGSPATNVSLDNSTISTAIFGGIAANTAANIAITAHTLALADRAEIRADTNGAAPAGDIVLHVGTLTSAGIFSTISSSSISFDDIAAGGNAGNITIQGITGSGSPATNVSLDSSVISTTIFGGTAANTAANIAITTHTLALAGGSSINADTLAAAPAGDIVLHVGTLTSPGSFFISSSSFPDLFFIPGAAGGNAGNITIQGITGSGSPATNVSLDSGSISTTIFGGTLSSAPANITIAAQSVTLSNGVSITASTTGNAPAGNIGLVTQQLTMTPDSAITSNALSELGGVGKAGAITITGAGSAPTTIAGGTVQAQSETSASAGNITLQAPGDLTILGTNVSVKNTGPGSAGSIDLRAGDNLLVRNSQVSTESAEASGGDIKLTAPDIIRLVDSRLTSSVQGQAESNGGNINIDPQLVVIQNSQLLANANAGAGGNINIAASGAVLIDPNSVLNATAGPAGVSGSININAPIQVLSGALVPLNLVYRQAGLSGDRCAADPTGQFSSFVQTGRDGVPQVPGALSPSPLSFMETLTSGSLGSPTSNWAAARLGLDYVSVDDSTRYWLHSACRS